MLDPHCIFTDRVRSTREGNVFSLSTPGGGGVPEPGPAGGETLMGGVARWGVPHLRYPPGQTWPGGTPPRVPPHQTWLGGTPAGGTPPRVPPIRPGWGGGLLHWVVLDTPRSVCLLRSRRRTCLYIIFWSKYRNTTQFKLISRINEANFFHEDTIRFAYHTRM